MELDRRLPDEIDPVNIVGSGDLGVEIDLEALSKDLMGASYDPDKYNGLYFRTVDDSPLVIIYRTGKYIITGCGSIGGLSKTRETTLSSLGEVGLIEGTDDLKFSVQNIVCEVDYGQDLNLHTVMLALGLEDTEYEPEQFPGLVYRPERSDCVSLLFSSGKIIITGCNDPGNISELYKNLIDKLTKVS